MQTQTITTTETGVVTKTKLAVATLAALAAAGAAFIVSPPVNVNIAPPVVKSPANGAVVNLPALTAVKSEWTAVPGATNYRFNLEYQQMVNGVLTWVPVFDYFRGNYTSNYTILSSGAGQYRLRIQAIVGNSSSPFSEYNYFTYVVKQMPDLMFGPNPQVPTFANKTLTIPWGNGGNTTTKFAAGQTVYSITALDANNVPVKSEIVVNYQNFSNPYIASAPLQGVTYTAGQFMQAVLNNVNFPTGTARISISLDPSKVITESNEGNNVFTITCPNNNCGPAVAGALNVSLDATSPTSSVYTLGSTGGRVAKFSVTANPNEDVRVNNIVASFETNNSKMFKNIRLVDAGNNIQIGNMIPALSNIVGGKVVQNGNIFYAEFSGLGWTVPRGTTKTFYVVTDFVSYIDLGAPQYTGYWFRPMLLKSYDNSNTPGSESIRAVGVASGSTIIPTYKLTNNFPWNNSVGASQHYVYRTNVNVSWSPDSPIGMTAPSAQQIIGKFIVRNEANVGNYTAIIKTLQAHLISNIQLKAPRTLSFYKDSVANKPLGTYIFNGATPSGESGYMANFTPVEIAAGGSATIFVTLDTTDALPGNMLSVRITYSGVQWSDGLSNSGFFLNAEQMLTFKVLNY